jgi:ABC-2 type transport system permease protein
MTTPPDLLAGSATGSIYDLGYRRYEGPRLGRRHAVGALVRHGLRAVFGLGRSARAKVVPLGLGGLIALPAVVSVAFTTLAGGAASEFNPINLEGYLQFSTVPLVFFVAAQAPELLVRDQRHRVLTLYFSRALERVDYVGAKYVVLVLAIALVIGLPQVILLLGMLFATPNLAEGVAEAAPLVAPAVARTAVVAALLAGVALAASAFTVRRAFAAATIIAVFLVPSAIISILIAEVDLGMPAALVALGDVVALVDGVSAFVFGSEPTTTTVLLSDVPVWLFAATAVVVSLAALGLLALRYRRIAA